MITKKEINHIKTKFEELEREYREISDLFDDFNYNSNLWELHDIFTDIEYQGLDIIGPFMLIITKKEIFKLHKGMLLGIDLEVKEKLVNFKPQNEKEEKILLRVKGFLRKIEEFYQELREIRGDKNGKYI